MIAGFQGMDELGDISTLGRGGSDTTAVAVAAALKLAGYEVECEIYTDVDGVYTTDPRIVPDARKMDAISYDEMLEMASMGAGVMHSRLDRVRQEVRRAADGAERAVRRHRNVDRAGRIVDERNPRVRVAARRRRGEAAYSKACRTAPA